MKAKFNAWILSVKKTIADNVIAFCVGAGISSNSFWGMFAKYLSNEGLPYFSRDIKFIIKHNPKKLKQLLKLVKWYKDFNRWSIGRSKAFEKIYYEAVTKSVYDTETLKKYAENFLNSIESKGFIKPKVSLEQIQNFLINVGKGRLKIGRLKYVINSLPIYKNASCASKDCFNNVIFRDYDSKREIIVNVSGKLKGGLAKYNNICEERSEDFDSLKELGIKLFGWMYLTGGEYEF